MTPIKVLLASTCILAGSSTLAAAQTPAELQQLHRDLLKALPAEQATAITAEQPSLLVVTSCVVHVNGAGKEERIVGAVLPSAEGQPDNQLTPLAVMWEHGKYVLHFINSDIAKDQWGKDRIHWDYTINHGVVSAAIKCGTDPYHEADISDNKGHMHVAKVKFPLTKKEAAAKPAFCFGTDSTYNNWDCVLFNRKDKRFRLWYRQAMAD